MTRWSSTWDSSTTTGEFTSIRSGKSSREEEGFCCRSAKSPILWRDELRSGRQSDQDPRADQGTVRSSVQGGATAAEQICTHIYIYISIMYLCISTYIINAQLRSDRREIACDFWTIGVVTNPRSDWPMVTRDNRECVLNSRGRHLETTRITIELVPF